MIGIVKLVNTFERQLIGSNQLTRQVNYWWLSEEDESWDAWLYSMFNCQSNMFDIEICLDEGQREIKWCK